MMLESVSKDTEVYDIGTTIILVQGSFKSIISNDMLHWNEDEMNSLTLEQIFDEVKDITCIENPNLVVAYESGLEGFIYTNCHELKGQCDNWLLCGKLCGYA